MEDGEMRVTLKFLHWQQLYETEKPFQIFINIPEDAEDKRTSNLVFEDVERTVQDVKTTEKSFSLDDNGFKLCKHSSSLGTFARNLYHSS